MHRVLALAALCLFAGPAQADEHTESFERFVMLMAGIGAGATVNVGHGAVSPVTRIGTGRYEVVVDRAGATMDFAVSEPRPCVLQLAVVSDGRPVGGGMRLDLNLVTGIDVQPITGEIPDHILVGSGQRYDGPLNAIAVSIAGTGDMLEASPDGVTSIPMTPHTTFLTSLGVDELRSAAAALRADCPGPAT